MPRVTFSLAEQGDLPRIFCSVSRKFHTPWFSILLYAVVIWILAGIGSFAWNVSLSVVSRLFYYGVVCVAVMVLRAREGPAKFRLPGGPLLPLLGVAVCIVLATQVDVRQSNIVCLTVLAALLHWTWLRTFRREKEIPQRARTGSQWATSNFSSIGASLRKISRVRSSHLIADTGRLSPTCITSILLCREPMRLIPFHSP